MNRVLVISPHPDDESIGCGGTLRKHVVQGDIIRVIFLTSGEKGGHGQSVENTRRLRQAEARRAAQILGLDQVEFWEKPDGAVRATPGLVKQLQELLAEWKPQFLYVPHEHEQHPDHRAALRLVQKALSEQGQRDGEPVVRMYEVWTPLQRMDHVEDISDHLKDKMAAIRAYKTQCRAVDFANAFRGLARYRGEMHCWPQGEYAEVFAELSPTSSR